MLRTGGLASIRSHAPCHRARAPHDQGFCFNAGDWDFPNAPLRGLYNRHLVYDSVHGMESFEPWLDRLLRITAEVLDELAAGIPPEWYNSEPGDLFRMLEHLDRRRARVRELLLDAKNSIRQPFRKWT